MFEGINLPNIDKRKGALLVLGCASNVWEDYSIFMRNPIEHEVMVINHMGAYWERRAHHWATMHPEFLPGWRHYRHEMCYGGREYTHTHAHIPGPETDYHWPIANLAGTSGLFGVMVGLLMGYEHVVLAGMPMDARPHFYDYRDPNDHYFMFDSHEEIWKQAINKMFNGRVRSLSGRTKEWCGGYGE